jgi:hypothetical protein
MNNWNKKLIDNIKAVEDAKLSAEVFKNDSRDLLLAIAKVNLLDDAKTKFQIKMASFHTTWDGEKRNPISELFPKHHVTKQKNILLSKLVAEAESLGADFSHRKFN